MHLFGVRTLLIVNATFAAVGAFAGAAAGGSAASWAGDWETVIANPKRPWIFLVRLSPDSSAWTGSMSIEGWADFPLHDVRVESERVRFRFPPELDSLAFEGVPQGDAIVGHVHEGEEKIPTRLSRLVPLPAPANRIEAWQQDIDVLSTRLPRYDRSFVPHTREEFRQALADLKESLADRSDADILVAISRAVALTGNAHTRLRLDPTRGGSFTTELPIRIWWFRDGPYVIRAAAAYTRVLRCKVVSVNGLDLSEARSRVETLFAGNPSWDAYLSPLYVTSPDILHGLGFIPDLEGASFTFEDSSRARFDLWIRSERIDPSAKPGESWQEISPLFPTGNPPWTPAPVGGMNGLPLYLRHPEKAYWFEFRPESGLLYFQVNRSGDDEQGQTLQQFGDSLLVFLEQHPVRKTVVDLRFNAGGDLYVAQAFVQRLARVEKINQRGRLFVITGNCTFSAGLYHAAQLRQLTQATFVGEPVGDHLDFWAEGGRITLPNSQAVICYSNGFHRYSKADYPEYRPYYEELSVSGLEPDLPAPMSSADYFSGRDPALEIIEAHLRE